MCNSVDISQIICHKMLYAIWEGPFFISSILFQFFFAYDDDDQKRSVRFWWFYRNFWVYKVPSTGVWHSLVYTNSRNFITNLCKGAAKMQSKQIFVILTMKSDCDWIYDNFEMIWFTWRHVYPVFKGRKGKFKYEKIQGWNFIFLSSFVPGIWDVQGQN